MAWLISDWFCVKTEETARAKTSDEVEFPAVGAAIAVNWAVRLVRSVATVEVGLNVLDVNPVPSPLTAEFSAVWSAETAVDTAVLSSAVPPEIEVCSALLIAVLNV